MRRTSVWLILVFLFLASPNARANPVQVLRAGQQVPHLNSAAARLLDVLGTSSGTARTHVGTLVASGVTHQDDAVIELLQGLRDGTIVLEGAEGTALATLAGALPQLPVTSLPASIAGATESPSAVGRLGCIGETGCPLGLEQLRAAVDASSGPFGNLVDAALPTRIEAIRNASTVPEALAMVRALPELATLIEGGYVNVAVVSFSGDSPRMDYVDVSGRLTPGSWSRLGVNHWLRAARDRAGNVFLYYVREQLFQRASSDYTWERMASRSTRNLKPEGRGVWGWSIAERTFSTRAAFFTPERIGDGIEKAFEKYGVLPKPTE